MHLSFPTLSSLRTNAPAFFSEAGQAFDTFSSYLLENGEKLVQKGSSLLGRASLKSAAFPLALATAAAIGCIFYVKNKSKKNEKAVKALPSYSIAALAQLANNGIGISTRIGEQFKELKKLQEEIQSLQLFLRALNTVTDSKGVLDFTGSPELQDLYESMNKRFNLTLPSGKTKFLAAERERLVENIKISLDEKNLKNNHLMLSLEQLNNERQKY